MDFRPFKIGKYLLLEKLATGGMAEVYRAKASGAGGFEKQLAIKRILPTYSQNDEFRRMFEYEARLSSHLTHANIVQVYDFVKSGETYLLAMEYVDGKNLRQFVNKARKMGYQISPAFSAYVMNEVAKGLEYAHGKKDDVTGKPLNIIHRDMSPQNIMLSYDGAVKIVDFGIAKAKDRVDETRSGVIKGKFGYMSPEQANGNLIDHRSDIFSTGIILFELASGKRLFSAENDMATLKMIQECVIPSPSRINPKIPNELEKIILKGLTKDLNLRYQNAGNMHRNLQSYLSKSFPNFTQKDAAETLQIVFRQEIENEKKRFEQAYRQSIPFSQGAEEQEYQEAEPDDGLNDGEVTKTDQKELTPITSVDKSIPDEPKKKKDPASIEATQVDEGGSEELLDEDGDDEGSSIPTLDKKDPTPTPKPIEPVKVDDSTRAGNSIRIPEDDSFSMPKLVRSGGASLHLRESQTDKSHTHPDTKTPTTEKTPSGMNAVGTKSRETATAQKPDLGDLILSSAVKMPSVNRKKDPLPSLREFGVDPEPRISLEAPKEPSKIFDSIPEYRPKKPSMWGKVFRTAILVGVTGLAYQFYLQGSFTDLLRALSERGPATKLPEEPKSSFPPTFKEAATPVTSSDECTLEAITDPAGAKLFVGEKEVGLTPSTVSLPCLTSVNLTFRLDGYEWLSQNEFLREKQRRVYKTLKRIPSGKLELVLTRNAKVFVDDKYVGEATANETFILTLRAPRKYHIRFVNDIFGLKAGRDFTIDVDSVNRETIRFDGQ